MSIVFPVNPVVGQSAYVSGTRYYFDGIAWTAATTNVLGSRRTKEYISTSGQTDYLTTFNLDNCEVYLNGIKLESTEYSISYTSVNGTVTLNEAASEGDVVEVVAYGTYDILNEIYVKSDTEPDPIANGMFWFNTTTNDLYVYDGTSWKNTLNIDVYFNDILETPNTISGYGITDAVDKINITGNIVGSATQIPVITYNDQGQITNTSIASIDSLPDQTDNTGKYLTTDGSAASWATLNVSGDIANAVSALVDSAPTTLDTLNELAAALGDDANFSTTVATNIGNVSSNLSSHTGNTSNPHGVTATQVGLGNVNNTSDVNKPVSTATQTALNLKADSSTVSAHTGNTSNPHGTTAAQVGLGNVEDKSSATIRSEITSGNVTTALGYTPQDSSTAITTSNIGSQSVNYATTSGNGVKGGGSDAIFIENGQTVTVDYTITSGNNAGTFGPVSIASGVTVTVPSGSVWTVV